MENLTPMIAQYHNIKNDYQDCLLLYRLGDFYELFYEDAIIGSKELNIVLTRKKISKDKDIPMCGIPYHSADSYIYKLVSKGYKVAICEQLEPASASKGIVKREVIRVITPGTYFDNEHLKGGVVALYKDGNKFAAAFLDLSVGEFFASKFNKESLVSFLNKFRPREILTPKDLDISFISEDYKNFFHNPIPEELFENTEEFLNHFNIKTIISFGFEDDDNLLKVIAAAFNYAKYTQKGFLPYIETPKPYIEDKYMKLDYSAIKHLEFVSSLEHGKSLFNVINKAITGMGKRKLKFFLLHPLKNLNDILDRQEAVAELVENHNLRETIRSYLNKVFDIETLISKITSNTLKPKDMIALRESLRKVEEMKTVKNNVKSKLLKDLFNSIPDNTAIVEKLDKYLEDDPPFHLKEGGLIKKGVDKTLDELRDIKENGEGWIKEYQEKERIRTGISSLKIGFNKVMGYYIEITKPNLKFVPSDYKRRQTLANAERFTTDYLTSLEEKILSADEKIKNLEYEIFSQVRDYVVNLSTHIEKTGRTVAVIDAITSLAHVAVENGWIKPKLTNGYKIHIEEGFHPTVAKFQKDFVPNSVSFDKDRFYHIITGPNMSGKSTYIRQVALLVILSQIGSFIPAKSAEIGIVDAVYTRIGSGDNLAKGLSTFMVEMLEVANIINNASENSLIILDEIGRGTSTYDGIAIAWAVSEYIVNKIKAKTMFSTHYHELVTLKDKLEGVENYHLAIKEDEDGGISFLYKVVEGFSPKSYGIHVAKLAGIKEEIIKRALEILNNLENQSIDNNTLTETKEIYNLFESQICIKEEISPKTRENYYKDDIYSTIIEEIENLDIGNTTPLDALIILNTIKNKLKTLKSIDK